MSEPSLLVMAKRPQLGKVKTRLANDLGDQNALLIYNELLTATEQLLIQADLNSYVFATGNGKEQVFQSFKHRQFEQVGDDLGQRMRHAFETAFAEFGAHPCLMIGTDCPEISVQHLENAVAALREHDAVLGPSKDGGYYLIGMNELIPDLFEGISWSTDQVLHQSLSALTSGCRTATLIDELNDIDTLDDLKKSVYFASRKDAFKSFSAWE